MSRFLELKKKHKLFLIEDCAHRFMGKYKNSNLGTIGDFGAFSFHETKNLVGGQCGAISINNNAFCALATKIDEKAIQNHLMWVDFKGNKILINTEQGRRKTENIRQEPNVSLVIFDPSDMYTCWEIRGVVGNIVQDSSANDHIDYLSNRNYLNNFLTKIKELESVNKVFNLQHIQSYLKIHR